MNARKIFLPLALLLLFCQSFYAQTAAPDSSVTIKILNGRRILSGSVADENSKKQIIEKVQTALGSGVDASRLKIVPNAVPFNIGWETSFDKSLAKLKNWKNGIFVFTGAAVNQLSEYPNVPENILNARITLDNNKIVRLADYGNKIVALFFLESWCGPCRTQADEFNKFYSQMSSPDLEIIAVSSETDADERKEFQEFVRRQKFSFQTGWAEKSLFDATIKISKMNGVPQTLVVRNGKLYGVFFGANARINKQFEALIKKMLADKNLQNNARYNRTNQHDERRR
jgi:peroxiredoxin